MARHAREYRGAGCKLLVTPGPLKGRKAKMEQKNKQKLLHRFRMIGIAEGISFLVLLLIAMPLKYFMHLPEAVKIMGWIHGALFVSFIYFAFEVMGSLNKPFSWFIKAFVAAFIPLGTFVFDKQLKREADMLAAS